MERKYPNLCSPLRIGNLIYKNRMVSAPLATPFITKDGLMTREGIAYYEERAKGGAASVTVTEGVTHPETGQNYRRQLTLTDEDCLGMLSLTANAIRRHGTVAEIELSHGGKFIDIDIQNEYKAREIIRYGPSDEEELSQEGVLVREMPKEVIREVVRSFAVGADLAKRAGFNMILLHGGHGWLINQFLSPALNHRTDEYGGSTANRARLALEILDSIRSAVGPHFPIEFRLSAEEYCEGGYGLGEGIEIAKLVAPKIDLLQVSTGSHEGAFFKTHVPIYGERGEIVPLAAEVKKYVDVPVAAIGALNEPEMMEEIIAAGKADLVVMGRALLADPQLPNKVKEGRDDEIVKCIRCFDCMAERIVNRTRSCAVNPVIGHEFDPRETLSRHPKRVLVAGGGPAGLEAAITAAKCGHDVTLCEKSGELGGALLGNRNIDFKRDLVDLARVKALEAEKEKVDIRLHTEVTPELAEGLQPDVIIVAAGAEQARPPIPGLDSRNVLWGNELSEHTEEIGKRVAVIGGGLIGTDLAIFCARRGCDVTIFEQSDRIAREANVDLILCVMDEVEKRKINVRTNMRVTKVTEDGVTAEKAAGEEIFAAADTVICATGQKPRYNVFDALKDCAPQVIAIGDCVYPKDVHNAIWQGYHAGLDV